MPLTAEHGLVALAIAKSTNDKIGDAATTYAAQVSCPSSCAFYKGGGCYAENGTLFSGVTHPLNQAAEQLGLSHLDVARAEAAAIDALKVVAGRVMRVHTVGDCKTDETAAIVAAACARYVERGGGICWSYTHAWRTVDRAAWGCVSVLASCETPEQVELARARGYATAIVVEDFESRRLYEIGGDASSPATSCRTARPGARPGIAAPAAGALTGQRPGSASAPVTSARILPCPAQTTEGVTCATCRLCMDDGRLRRAGYSIGFAVHGTAFTTKKALESLRTPGDESRRLTSRDHAHAYFDEHGRWPRQAELQRLAGISQGSAKEMLERLRAERTHREEARV